MLSVSVSERVSEWLRLFSSRLIPERGKLNFTERTPKLLILSVGDEGLAAAYKQTVYSFSCERKRRPSSERRERREGMKHIYEKSKEEIRMIKIIVKRDR